MNRWLRRIRGAIGMGLTWGAAWLGAGLVMMLGLLLLTGSTGADVPYPLGFGALGFLAGTTFSGVLGLVEGRRRFEDMSLPRFAGWGAAGGFLLAAMFVATVSLVEDPSFLGNLPVLGTVFAGAGAVCAGGALTLARRAERRMLESGDGAVEFEPTRERGVLEPGGPAPARGRASADR
jgi:hypothetical protein